MPEPTDEPLPESMRKALDLNRRAREAGFADDGATGPHEAALRASHNEAALAPATVFTLGGRTFVLQKPTAADLMGIRRHLIDCVQAGMTTALESTLAAFKRMRAAAKDAGGEVPFDEEDYRAALEMAIATESKKAAGPKAKGKAEPTGRQVEEYLNSTAGVREYLWRRLALAEKDVTREWVEQHVTDANVLEVVAQLGKDTGVPLIDPKSTCG